MTFKPGEVSNPKGRPVGSENKINSQIKRRISAALRKIDDDVLLAAITGAKPGDILGFLAKLAPKDLHVKHSGGIKNEAYDLSKLSTEELETLQKLQSKCITE
jgi:hypothetical protein